ncbi:MAG: 2-dehydropantoate 2-reductase [Flavobacteriales bacterium]|nr:2-dehydropantoate 2-reductase [Flavobacteriales bacterium]
MEEQKGTLKVGVVGMGPVGQILAVHLKEAGCHVTICDRNKERVDLIRKDGLRLEGKMARHVRPDQAFHTASELAAEKPDVIILAIKVYHTRAVIEELLGASAGKPFIICAQNGIDVEEPVADVFGEQYTFRMVLNFAGNLAKPNAVNVTFFNAPNYIASVDDTQEVFAQRFAEILASVDLDTLVVDSFSLVDKVWEKTILNSSLSALCGISRLTIREAMEQPGMAEIIEQVIEESVQVAKAEDIRFGDNFIKLCMRYLRKAGNHFPSLAVDMMKDRQTEIEHFNGQFVKYGRKHYVRTPLNLLFTNLVQAHTKKGATLEEPEPLALAGMFAVKGTGAIKETSAGGHYVGVDIGSYYTKISVIDEAGEVVYRELLRTLNRDKNALYGALEDIKGRYDVAAVCASGYGREHFPAADTTKTEVSCAAFAIDSLYLGRKNIVDIGAEDIKLIRAGDGGKVEEFYMNNKCAAGTGAFITEVAERAEIDLRTMSELAGRSEAMKELNSFCTVFAKTEIMGWIFEEMPVEDIAKGIYLSVANRIYKIRMEAGLPIYLVGGVIAYHPYFKTILSERFGQEVIIPDQPQFIVSLGAALFARKHAHQQQATAGPETNEQKERA